MMTPQEHLEGARDYAIQVGRMNGKGDKCLEALVKLDVENEILLLAE